MGGGQIGIVAEIEFCGSAFDLGDDELLDRVETDRAEPDRVERRRGDHGFGKDLHQPQRLDELAFAAIAHPPFKEPPQMLERFRKCPILQGSRLVQGAGLLLEERQIVLRVEDELSGLLVCPGVRCRRFTPPVPCFLSAPVLVYRLESTHFTRTQGWTQWKRD